LQLTNISYHIIASARKSDTKYAAGCTVNTVHVLNKTTVKIGMGSLDQIVRDLGLKFGVLTHSYVSHNCLNLMDFWLFAL
jgi:hypothetical protein